MRVVGALAPGPRGGSRVRLHMSPPAVVVVSMAMWLAFLAAVAAVIVDAHALAARRTLLWLLAPASLAGFSCHLMASVFAADARWAVEDLLERLPALRPAPPDRERWNYSRERASMVEKARE